MRPFYVLVLTPLWAFHAASFAVAQDIPEVRIAFADGEKLGQRPYLRIETVEKLPGKCMAATAGEALSVRRLTKWSVVVDSVYPCPRTGQEIFLIEPAGARVPLPHLPARTRLEVSIVAGMRSGRYEVEIDSLFVVARTIESNGIPHPQLQVARLRPGMYLLKCRAAVVDPGVCRALSGRIFKAIHHDMYLIRTYYSVVPPFYHPFAPRDSSTDLADAVLLRVSPRRFEEIKTLVTRWTMAIEALYDLLGVAPGGAVVRFRDPHGGEQLCQLGRCQPVL